MLFCKTMKRLSFFLITVIILSTQNCLAENIIDVFDPIDLTNIETEFNNNVRNIYQLIILQENDGTVESTDSSPESIRLCFQDADTDVVFHRTSVQKRIKYPALSILPDDGVYYWTIANEYILDEAGKRIRVNNEDLTPVFHFSNGCWYCTIDGFTTPIEERQLTNKVISVEEYDDDFVVITFPSSYQMTLPMSSFNLPSVPLQAFYKDVFLDAGIGLTSRKFLYAAQHLGLSLEGISFPRTAATLAEEKIQNSIIAGNDEDWNGRLLYPDGQPRYRLLFVNGGSSKEHGQSMSGNALNNMRKFVQNGGSYVGTCAGAFFASNGYDTISDYPYYLSLWPSTQRHTGISGETTGMFVETDSPLLNYYDFGGDYYIGNVRHNKGGYPVNLPCKTEVLARYDCPNYDRVHMQPSVWAYKTDNTMGRIVMEGSHPEEVSSGERRDLTAAMMLYAMDGQGQTTSKGFLQNGLTRKMTSSSDEDKPTYAKIGDKQCHHFVVCIPPKATNISFSLDGVADCDLLLAVNKHTFAYPNSADYVSSDGDEHQSLSFKNLESGLWYVAVQNLTTVDVTETSYGQSYTGNTDVLNGIPYYISVSWDIPEEIIRTITPKDDSVDLTQPTNIFVRIDGSSVTDKINGIVIKKQGDNIIKSFKK